VDPDTGRRRKLGIRKLGIGIEFSIRNNMRDIAEYQGFLELWRTEIRDPRIQRQSEFIDAFNRFRDVYLKLKKETEESFLTHAPGYNIFKLLRVDRDEVKYSAFLANLLDPNESHGQGKLFLHSFLEYCSNRYPDFPVSLQELTLKGWGVIPEKIIKTEADAGRVDICILNTEIGHLFLIENKIDAKEQSSQLVRYAKWMEDKKDDFPTRALIFLTLTGYEAATSEGYSYFQLSYHHDITSWLKPTIDQIQAPAVREVVSQYLEIIQSL
jgi:hypothetical protein